MSYELKRKFTKCLSFPFIRFSTFTCGNKIKIHWVIHKILQLYSTAKLPCWQRSERRRSNKAAVKQYKTGSYSLQTSHSRGDAGKGSHRNLNAYFSCTLITDWLQKCDWGAQKTVIWVFKNITLSFSTVTVLVQHCSFSFRVFFLNL